ncbi:SMC-Scp complex subunit ScpB [Candidatus Acetothermia bacterium]|nr:SMC-Scp complex subunit ScpB [Candidatus Acetothermia bacterium]
MVQPERVRDKALLEAALFLTAKPLSRTELAKIIGTKSPRYVEELLSDLADDLIPAERGIKLQQIEKSYLLQVKAEYLDAVAYLAPYQDISRPVLRTLAMIACNQPITQSELVRVRGNKCYKHVEQLLNQNLIRAEKHGRTLMLHVTEEFLRYFGLQNINELQFDEKEQKYSPQYVQYSQNDPTNS